jgi:hypothetical protein
VDIGDHSNQHAHRLPDPAPAPRPDLTGRYGAPRDDQAYRILTAASSQITWSPNRRRSSSATSR